MLSGSTTVKRLARQFPTATFTLLQGGTVTLKNPAVAFGMSYRVNERTELQPIREFENGK